MNGKKLGKGQYSRIVDGDVLSLVSSSGWKNKEGTSISISYRFASENVNFKSSSSPRTPQKSGSFGQLPLNSSYRKLRKRVKSYSLCALCFILIICLFLLKLIPN